MSPNVFQHFGNGQWFVRLYFVCTAEVDTIFAGAAPVREKLPQNGENVTVSVDFCVHAFNKLAPLLSWIGQSSFELFKRYLANFF